MTGFPCDAEQALHFFREPLWLWLAKQEEKANHQIESQSLRGGGHLNQASENTVVYRVRIIPHKRFRGIKFRLGI